jgi:uncharacterized membrane protein YheB (UPF0754 family)
MSSLLLIPIMTGFLGWFLAWLFVKSLFFPYQTITIGNYKWNAGLKHLINKFPIEQIFPADNSNFDAVLPFIDAKLDDFFKRKLSEKLPIISMFIGDKTIHQLKEVFIEELKQLFPELVVNLVANSKAQLLNNLEQKWRPIIEPTLLLGTKNLRWIAFVIGFMWGVLILLIIH